MKLICRVVASLINVQHYYYFIFCFTTYSTNRFFFLIIYSTNRLLELITKKKNRLLENVEKYFRKLKVIIFIWLKKFLVGLQLFKKKSNFSLNSRYWMPSNDIVKHFSNSFWTKWAGIHSWVYICSADMWYMKTVGQAGELVMLKSKVVDSF